MTKKNKSICFPFIGDSIGGSQLASIILIKNLKFIGFNYKVILMDHGPLEKILIKEKIKYEVLKIRKSKFNLSIFLFLLFSFFKAIQLRSYIIRNKIEILHTNDLRMHYFWSVICKINNIYHIWHQHSAYYSRRNIFFSYLSNKILTVSNFCKNSFTSEMSKRALVLSNPFEKKLFINENEKTKINNILRKKMKISKNTKIISFIGNRKSQKRLNIFLKLIVTLEKIEFSDVFFFVIGNFENSDPIFKDIKKSKMKIIKNKYYLKNYFAISNIIISPAINEGFGRTIIEAMMTQTPVIASNSGAHKELIKHKKNGFLCKIDSEKDFIKEILFILSKKNKLIIQKIIKNAFKDVKEKYKLIYYLKKFKKIYDR